ncbi:MarR family winged helix-turn-helix transcriptional regulator [Pigmentiphaga kullae]|uniref:DNA-binding MarR family transcriptional regulator n=1 Tax=Pigmentiphaga kullae TaxID=151784 RepID=A0A4Q7ND64_9BURK|nr:MarR family transcriptional regulator [Pigmentiphaga kullae]RZS80936.1 DNA-binding MarR family transcriptional regulator [Pigmentiphaga kullae]
MSNIAYGAPGAPCPTSMTAIEAPAAAERPHDGKSRRGGLDRRRLDHLLGFMTSLADATLRKAFVAHMGDLKLRPVEFSILALLAVNQRVTQKKLCLALDTPAPNLVVVLTRLQERGLLRRIRSEEDRREQHVELTDEGRQLADLAHARSQAMEAGALSVLTAGEQLLLFELLRKIATGGRPA